jgi:glycosyltransferase involved in cell wall biosynthesis
MSVHKISVVIPIYNEAGHIGKTVEALEQAVAELDGMETELVVVDDGSVDGSGERAAEAATTLPVEVVRQENAGRLAARRSGLERASGDYVLFLDSRVRLLPGSLGFVRGRLAAEDGEQVWNAHCYIDTTTPYGRFWNVLTELAFADYFSAPRTTSFGEEAFDRFPKGTTCFLAPREALKKSFTTLHSYYADERRANDDTPIIRSLALSHRVWISPEFACLYKPRTSLRLFVRHAFHRGIVFVDGHGRRESRFFPAVLAFYPLSAGCVALVLKRPALAPALPALTAVAAAAFAARHRRSVSEIVSFGMLAPVYAASHGAGMWRALGFLARGLAGRRKRWSASSTGQQAS